MPDHVMITFTLLSQSYHKCMSVSSDHYSKSLATGCLIKHGKFIRVLED